MTLFDADDEEIAQGPFFSRYPWRGELEENHGSHAEHVNEE